MARSSTSYRSAVDLWDESTRAALDAGELRLQSGQWIKCGSAVPSRFHHHNPATGHVCAFHGHKPGSGQASRRYLMYVEDMKAAAVELADKRARRAAAAVAPLFRVAGTPLRKVR